MKHYILCVLFSVSFGMLQACESCGVSSSPLSSAFLNGKTGHYFGAGWNYTSFHSLTGSDTKDYFNTYNFRMRIQASDKFSFEYAQPFKNAYRISEDGRQELSGISDSELLVTYRILSNDTLAKDLYFGLNMGAGVKLPIGNYNSQLHDENLPLNFIQGNGSWAYLIQPQVILNYKKDGWVGLFRYTRNQESSSGYYFGDQKVWHNAIFTRIEKFPLAVTPLLGLYGERIIKVKYANGKEVMDTGGNGTFAMAGMNIEYRSYIIQGTVFKPFDQQYSDNTVKTNDRFSLQLIYRF